MFVTVRDEIIIPCVDRCRYRRHPAPGFIWHRDVGKSCGKTVTGHFDDDDNNDDYDAYNNVLCIIHGHSSCRRDIIIGVRNLSVRTVPAKSVRSGKFRNFVPISRDRLGPASTTDPIPFCSIFAFQFFFFS